MNRQERDILLTMLNHPFSNQRELARHSGHSLGIVNRSIKQMKQKGYLDEQLRPTALAEGELTSCAPKNAVILAAGYGMRMVPIGTEVPKAFLEVNGEPLIERLIRQLHQVGIRDISVVVGFMREQFEYLIDAFGVELIVNRDYGVKNNLHSLALAADRLSNTYIVPCDIWCRENPFRLRELYPWYMVSSQLTEEGGVRLGRNLELAELTGPEEGNTMIGIAYLMEGQSAALRMQLRKFDRDRNYDRSFWESALFAMGDGRIPARVVDPEDVVEINTYEALRELDRDSLQLKSRIIGTVASALCASDQEIQDITVLKKGMTNRSFRFSCRGKQYIMRIPGEGTDQLINRQEEAAVYNAIAPYGLSDNVVFLDPSMGFKITEYLTDVRTCDPKNQADVEMCIAKLRRFHDLKLKVGHRFDIFGQIDFYESLWQGKPSAYRDYAGTKANIFSLREYLQAHAEPEVLTHIDAVPDNFLISDNDGAVRLIDWEYAGMQDPHVDIAMFCIYSMYDPEEVDRLIDAYFTEGCPEPVRTKIYGYIAACGLLWSNWCEYKRQLGVEFGEYSLQQYRYAKVYYRIARKRMEAENDVSG